MKQALSLARLGHGQCHPNPMVGAVIVHNGRIVSRGYHTYRQKTHAEVKAIGRCDPKRLKRSTLYVTLEPCSSQGRTPACCDAIVRAGIARVMIGSIDPNPKHQGRAVTWLRRQGLDVVTGILQQECEDLNQGFFTVMTRRRPFVWVKVAQSLDGKIATRLGDAHWISSEASRKQAHRMRQKVDGIIVGANTVLKDNPILTIRYGLRDTRPVRIIMDGQGRVMKAASRLRMFQEYRDTGAPILLFTQKKCRHRPEARALQKKGVWIESVPLMKNKTLSLPAVLKKLVHRHIYVILLEGGSALISSFARRSYIDKVSVFIAPLLIGGQAAPGFLEGQEVLKISQAKHLENVLIRKIGEDVLIEGTLRQE